jgi:hypothetical protein
MNQRQLHLNINILNAGFQGGAWRAASSDPAGFVDVQHYVRAARIAERGTFDAVFLADTPSFAERPEYRHYQALEPTIVLATIAAATDRIGLIGTASSTYNDPYNLPAASPRLTWPAADVWAGMSLPRPSRQPLATLASMTSPRIAIVTNVPRNFPIW